MDEGSESRRNRAKQQETDWTSLDENGGTGQTLSSLPGENIVLSA